MIIYIVVGDTGEHDDRDRWNEVASFDKQLCEEYIVSLLKEREKNQSLKRQLDVFNKDWEEFNEYGHWVKPRMKFPKWPSGMKKADITPLMQKERDDIKAMNEQIDAENQAEGERQAELWSNAQDEYIKNIMKITDEKEVEKILGLDSSVFEKISYSIEELKCLR